MRFLPMLAAALLVGCGGSDSAPTPQPGGGPAAPTALTFARASFFDNFNRPNTANGLGPGWDMRGAYVSGFPLPAATDGYISNGQYTYAGQSVVYAVRQFRGTVRRMGAFGRWHRIGDGGETTLAMAITPNDLLITDMVHLVASRSHWELTVRRGGGTFDEVASGTFSPVLDLDRDYWFEISATDSTVTVSVPGLEVSKNVDVSALVGRTAFWEEYPNARPSGVVFQFDAAWAAEEGQPLLDSASLLP